MSYSGPVYAFGNNYEKFETMRKTDIEEVIASASSGGSGVRTCRVVVGSQSAGWTQDDCDYLCDGNNDEVEIQQAINSLINKQSGGEVVLLAGEYNIKASLEFTASATTPFVVIRGSSPGLVTLLSDIQDGSNSLSAKGCLFFSGNVEGAAVCDLGIKGASTLTQVSKAFGIVTDGIPVLVRGCKFSGIGSGLFIRSDTSGVRVFDCDFIEDGETYVSNTNGIKARANVSDMMVSNCRFKNVYYGVYASSGTFGESEKVSVANCLFDTCYFGLYLQQFIGLNVSGCEAFACRTPYNLESNCGMTVVGNVARGVTNNGTGISAGTGAVGSTERGRHNIIVGNYLQSDGTAYTGIDYDGSSTFGGIISGNTVVDFTTGIKVASKGCCVNGNIVHRGTGQTSDYSGSDFSISLNTGAVNSVVVGNVLPGRVITGSPTGLVSESNMTDPFPA